MFNIDISRLWETLPLMGQGMLGIFIVMGILIVGTGLLNRILSGKNKNNE